MKTYFFLAGGGGEEQSKEIDNYFSKFIDGKKLIYIPIALNRDSIGFEACYDWITHVFSQFEYKIDVPRIDMFLDPESIFKNIENYDAIYIGGGNTFKLLDFFNKNNLSAKLRNFYNSGRPVYGGSAGAIILGSDIRTVDEENDANYPDFSGFNVLKNNTSIICHYDQSLDKKILDFINKYKQNVIALPEDSGLYVEDGFIKRVFGSPKQFSKDGIKEDLIIDKIKRVIVCDYDNPNNELRPV